MITRDTFQKSLWQDTIEAYKTRNTASPDELYDVIIIGGGITGVTTALFLQESGKRCLLIEADTLCYGTTGGTTAHLNTLLDTPYPTIEKNFSKDASKKVAQATAEAIALVRSNISKYGIQCFYEDAPAFLYADNDDQDKELEDILRATTAAGVQVAYTDNIPIPASFTSAIRVEGQAKFHPLRYVFALAEAFEAAGGAIIQYSRVDNVEEKHPLRVETPTATYKANDVIYATHIPMGINLLHLRCAPYRSYAMAAKLDDGTYPEGLIYDMYDPYFYYRTQVIDNEKYLIVGGKDHKTGHEENTYTSYLQLEAKIKSLYPGSRITHQWSSQYYEPTDGLPYIGHLPQHGEHIYVATGFGGNGITYSHVAARVLADMILNSKDRYDDLFNPKRVKPVAGFTNFIRHNADVTKEFLGKLFHSEKLKELSDLSPGEGRLVSFEGKKLGLYKAESGEIFAVNPICTHMKCDVKWNTSEKSWDCPCHGGRFDPRGKVLNGPPSQNLEQVNLAELFEKNK